MKMWQNDLPRPQLAMLAEWAINKAAVEGSAGREGRSSGQGPKRRIFLHWAMDLLPTATVPTVQCTKENMANPIILDLNLPWLSLPNFMIFWIYLQEARNTWINLVTSSAT